MHALIDRFIRYTGFDTQSNEEATQTPSTPGQAALAAALADELRRMGVDTVTVDNHAYLVAKIPGRGALAGAPCIGLLAHLDTAGEFSGANVKPRVIESYDGTAIALGNDRLLDPAVFPILRDKVGKRLIITDGSTLLGGDDKAGIAIMMTVIEQLLANPEQPHPPLAIAFTPDEEIGHGASLLDLAAFGADFAYTVDGGAIGTIEYENFNAAYATITINGRTVHPGDAKGKMVNAILLAQEFLDKLPEDERPATTDGRDGFFHVDTITGTVEHAEFGMLIRNHDSGRFEEMKARLHTFADALNREYPAGTGEAPRVAVAIRDQYRNMIEKIQPVMHIVETAKQAMQDIGIQPLVVPIRGGTDGARLSWRGLPCPNLFFGGYNMHGPYEFVVVEEMQSAVATILGILRKYAQSAP